MRITELHLKHFGKFSDHRIVMKDGINLFYGENETGKTTIHTFIKCMLFGLERGRGRASVNDTFQKYAPWDNPNYYAGTMRFESGGKHFLLERSFDKYTKSARLICEDDGEEFSLEHGDLEMILNGLQSQEFENTVFVGQMQVEPNQSLAAQLQNFATNYYATGTSDIDLDGALLHLQKRKKSIESEMRLTQQKKQEQRRDIEQERTYVWREIQKLEQELSDTEAAYEKEKNEQRKAYRKAEEEGRWRVSPFKFVVMGLSLILTLFALPRPWNYLVMIVLLLAEGMYVWNFMKEDKKKAPADLLQEHVEARQKTIWKKERLEGELKEKRTTYNNLEENLQELDEPDDTYRQQDMKRRAVEFAMEHMVSLSKDVHQELRGRLNEKASEILGEITDGKYTKLFVDEKLKMSIFNGERKVELWQLSRGTMEQIYFSLRMAASDLMHEEEYPVILDDTFVYYDDKRLECTLKWLAKHKKQVLLFTCQKREGQILQKLGE